MNRELNINYFKITPLVPDEQLFQSQEELKLAFQFPNNRAYTNVYQTNGKVDLYGDRVIRNHLILGTFTFIQLENIPPKQNIITKNIEDLQLEETDGLGHQTSFLFDTLTNIIVVVSRRPGVNASSIHRFVKENFDVCTFSLEFVQKPSSLENFLRTSSYKKLKVKLAQPANINHLLREDGGVNDTLKLMNKFASNKISFEVESMTRESLDIGTVRNFVNVVRRNFTDNIEVLRITGNDENVEEKSFDFISNRVKQSISVEVTRFGKFKTREVYDELVSKYSDIIISLRQTYANLNE
jgi:hypothetical protein